jgi:hypothetical protein
MPCRRRKVTAEGKMRMEPWTNAMHFGCCLNEANIHKLRTQFSTRLSPLPAMAPGFPGTHTTDQLDTTSRASVPSGLICTRMTRRSQEALLLWFTN